MGDSVSKWFEMKEDNKLIESIEQEISDLENQIFILKSQLNIIKKSK